MAPEELGAAALGAILAGTDITLHLPKGEKWPQGWPRGELLSVNELGKNCSFDPLKVVGFMQRLAKLSNGHPSNFEGKQPAANEPNKGNDYWMTSKTKTKPLAAGLP